MTTTPATLHSFYDALGADGRAKVTAVSMDVSTIYRDATREALPQATICFDPFHVIKWANEALEGVHPATPFGEPPAVPGISPQRAALPYMRTQGRGRIIDISSVGGFVPNLFMAVYVSTKHAVEVYSESLDHGVREHGVRVLLVQPGPAPSPAGRPGMVGSTPGHV